MFFNVLIHAVLLPLADWFAAAVDTLAVVLEGTLTGAISGDAASWD